MGSKDIVRTEKVREDVSTKLWDTAKYPPPRNFEKLKDKLEALKNIDNISIDEIPQEVMDYFQEMFSPEVLPQDITKWPHADQLAWFRKYYSCLYGYSKPIIRIMPGLMYDGDNLREPTELPDWMDVEKFHRGQKFAQKYFFCLTTSMLVSFLALYTFQRGVRVLQMTGKSSTPYEAFERYLSSVLYEWEWYTGDPWIKGGKAYKLMKSVRKMHQSVRNKIQSSSFEEIQKASALKSTWCPMRDILQKDFQSADLDNNILKRPYVLIDKHPSEPKYLSQADMALTQAGFIMFPLLYPKEFGIHDATDQDFEDFCFLWRALGFFLGMEDEFNFADGSLEEIKERSKFMVEAWIKPNFKDCATPEWEHMIRCMVEGVAYFSVPVTFETVVLWFGSIIDVPMPRFRAACSFYSRVFQKCVSFFYRYVLKLPIARWLCHKTLLYRMNNAATYSPEKRQSLKEQSEKTLLKNSVIM